MVNKLIDGVSFLYPSPHPENPNSKPTNSTKNSTRQSRNRTGRPPRNCCTKSPMPPTTSKRLPMQREVAKNFGIFVGEAEAQIVEEGAEGRYAHIQALHLADFLLKYGPTSLVNSLKENIYEFRNFDNYTLMADGVDRGESSILHTIQSANNREHSCRFSPMNKFCPTNGQKRSKSRTEWPM